MATGFIENIALFFAEKVFTHFKKEKKSLCYEIVTKYPFISVAPHIKDSEWNVSGAANLDGYHIRIRNDGNVPITNQILSFTFDADSFVYRVDYFTIPIDAQKEIKEINQEDSDLLNIKRYSFKLLNPHKKFKDEFNFFILVANSKVKPIIAARAPNLICHEYKKEEKTFSFLLGVLSGTIFSILVLAFTVNALFLKYNMGGTLELILMIYFLLFSLLGVITYIYTLINYSQYKKSMKLTHKS